MAGFHRPGSPLLAGRSPREAFFFFLIDDAKMTSALHRCAIVPFDQSGDSPQAFANANTLAELQQLESL